MDAPVGCVYGYAMAEDALFAKLADLVPSLRARFGVRELSVFGSVARGEAKPDSDLDLLVEFEGGTTFDAFMGTKLAIEDALGVRVDLVTRAALKPRLASAHRGRGSPCRVTLARTSPT